MCGPCLGHTEQQDSGAPLGDLKRLGGSSGIAHALDDHIYTVYPQQLLNAAG